MSGPELKSVVKEFWNQNPCNEQFGGSAVSRRAYFEENEAQRYYREPEIFEFAQFTRFHGAKILEVGVGMGADFLQWVRAGTVAHGVDFTETGVALAAERLASYGLKPASLTVADAENLPFADDTFDLVYSWGVIHHSPDTVRALFQLHRVCKPGGMIKFMVYNKWSAVALMYWAKFALLSLNPFVSISGVFANHIESPGTKVYSIREVRSMIESLGAADLLIRCYRPYFTVLSRYPSTVRPFIRLAGAILVFVLGGVARGGYFLCVQFRKPGPARTPGTTHHQ